MKNIISRNVQIEHSLIYIYSVYEKYCYYIIHKLPLKFKSQKLFLYEKWELHSYLKNTLAKNISFQIHPVLIMKQDFQLQNIEKTPEFIHIISFPHDVQNQIKKISICL